MLTFNILNMEQFQHGDTANMESSGIQHLEGSNEFANPDNDVELQDNLRRSRRHKKLKRYARAIRGARKNKKVFLMRMLKRTSPDISLREFCELYLKQSDSMENSYDQENYEIADSIDNEDHASRRSRRRSKRKARKKRRKAIRKMPKKQRKAARKKIRKKRRAKIKKALKKVGKRMLIATALGPIIAPILPLRPLMVKQIKKKTGKNMRRSDILEIMKEFHNKVIKKSSFEADSNLDHIEDDYYKDTPLYAYDSIDDFLTDYSEDQYEDYVAVSAVAKLVKTVLGFIKKIVQKVKSAKKRGKSIKKELTPDEQAVATDTKKLLNKIASTNQKTSSAQVAQAVTQVEKKEPITGLDLTKITGSKKSAAMLKPLLAVAVVAILYKVLKG